VHNGEPSTHRHTPGPMLPPRGRLRTGVGPDLRIVDCRPSSGSPSSQEPLAQEQRRRSQPVGVVDCLWTNGTRCRNALGARLPERARGAPQTGPARSGAHLAGPRWRRPDRRTQLPQVVRLTGRRIANVIAVDDTTKTRLDCAGSFRNRTATSRHEHRAEADAV
jgi:hypothetical protein